jgi:hypothetical protein
MADARRPPIVSRRTSAKKSRHAALSSPAVPAPLKHIDRVIIELGYISIAGSVYSGYRKLTPLPVIGITIGALALGYGFFALGKGSGMVEEALFAISSAEEERRVMTVKRRRIGVVSLRACSMRLWKSRRRLRG